MMKINGLFKINYYSLKLYKDEIDRLNNIIHYVKNESEYLFVGFFYEDIDYYE